MINDQFITYFVNYFYLFKMQRFYIHNNEMWFEWMCEYNRISFIFNKLFENIIKIYQIYNFFLILMRAWKSLFKINLIENYSNKKSETQNWCRQSKNIRIFVKKILPYNPVVYGLLFYWKFVHVRVATFAISIKCTMQQLIYEKLADGYKFTRATYFVTFSMIFLFI